MNIIPGMGRKPDSIFVTVVSSLSLAVAFLAVAAMFIPFLSGLFGGIAVFISGPAVLLAIIASLIALARGTRLALPAIALIVGGVPAARFNWIEARKVWVESAELCRVPLVHASVVGIVASLAFAADHKKAVGTRVCEKLGRHYADSDCDGPIGMIKCEP